MKDNLILIILKVKDKNRQTGEDATTCENFEEMNEIWGDQPSIEPPPGSIIDSLESNAAAQNTDCGDYYDNVVDKEITDEIDTTDSASSIEGN